jgi:hypothetical protein
LYGVGRLKFDKTPLDQALVSDNDTTENKDSYTLMQDNQQLKSELSKMKAFVQTARSKNAWKTKVIIISSLLITIVIMGFYYKNYTAYNELVKDYNIKPYSYSKSEKEALEGIWLNYIGSPQVRISDPDRENLIVFNISEIEEKDGYFICTRYGYSFNHTGYAQFESPNVVSIHLKVSTLSGTTNSPRHSLLLLDSSKKYLNIISASWNSDIGHRNKIIGVREVYSKIGKGGKLTEILNTVENAECKCKIINWEQDNGKVQEFHLKNMLIDTIQPALLRSLIDKKSILLKDLEDSILFKRNEN